MIKAKKFNAKVQGIDLTLRPMSAKTMRQFNNTEDSIDKLLIVFAGCVVDKEGNNIYNSPEDVENADLDLDFIAEVVSKISEQSNMKKKADN
jgi:hypothetical protein